MSTVQTIYNIFFRKNYSMLGLVFGSAFVFEIAYDRGMDRLWDSFNKGRQWKDIKSRYMTNPTGAGDEVDEDED